MLALVAVREHRPARRPPVDPVAHVRALVAPVTVPRVRRPATGAVRRPRPADAAPAAADGAGAGVGGRLVRTKLAYAG